jgi:hypothetical protein
MESALRVLCCGRSFLSARSIMTIFWSASLGCLPSNSAKLTKQRHGCGCAARDQASATSIYTAHGMFLAAASSASATSSKVVRLPLAGSSSSVAATPSPTQLLGDDRVVEGKNEDCCPPALRSRQRGVKWPPATPTPRGTASSSRSVTVQTAETSLRSFSNTFPLPRRQRQKNKGAPVKAPASNSEHARLPRLLSLPA